MDHVHSPSLDSVEAGAPVSESDIEVTPAMIEAGVTALEEWILDGELIRTVRPEAVRDIYMIMRAKTKGFGKPVNFVREDSERPNLIGKTIKGNGLGITPGQWNTHNCCVVLRYTPDFMNHVISSL